MQKLAYTAQPQRLFVPNNLLDLHTLTERSKESSFSEYSSFRMPRVVLLYSPVETVHQKSNTFNIHTSTSYTDETSYSHNTLKFPILSFSPLY